MPTYMDIHEIKGGIAAEEVAKAHANDVAVEGKYGVHYHKYWVNESAGKIFCLCEAPTAEAAMQVHREAHGQVADKIIQVEPEVADLFLGGSEVNGEGAALLPGGAADARDPGIRTVLFTDIVDSTSLTQRLGDEMAMEFLHVHDRIREERDHHIKVRIGGAAGEPVERDNDIFGTTVQLAARLCSHAQPDQILVSTAVAELCIGKGLTFRPLGEVALKGFDRPVQVHAVECA